MWESSFLYVAALPSLVGVVIVVWRYNGFSLPYNPTRPQDQRIM